MSSLELLLTDGVIEEVVTRLKSGKEADLYLVQHRGEIVAAKLYKERHARNFHNNVAYREGRTVRNTRTQRAMDKGSRFGQAAAEEAWKATESDALHRLHAAGMRVPQPILFYEGVLLMEVVVDAEGHPAPRLIDAHVPQEVAAPFYADLRSQVIKMLTCDLIHGDLSPYNVLLAWNGPTIIDFPQVIGAAHNRQAASFFERDLRTLHRFFAAVDPSLEAHAGDAHKIWRAYERRELTPDFVPTPGDAAPRRHKGKARRGMGAGPRGANGHPAPHAPGPAQAQSHGRNAEPRAPNAPSHGRNAEPRGSHVPSHGRNAEPRGSHAPSHGRSAEPRSGRPNGRPQGRNGSGGEPPRGPQVERRPALGVSAPHGHRGGPPRKNEPPR